MDASTMTRPEVVSAIAARRRELDRLSAKIAAINATLPALPEAEHPPREAEIASLREQAVAILDGEVQPLQTRLAELDDEQRAATHADTRREQHIASALLPQLRQHRIAQTQHEERLRQTIAQRELSAEAANRQANHLDRLRAVRLELHALAAEVGGRVGADMADASARIQAHEPDLQTALAVAIRRRDDAARAIAEVEAAIASEQGVCDRITSEIESVKQVAHAPQGA